MPSTPTRPTYFTALTLNNVKTFESEQTLSLCDKAGNPERWTLILGENGVGKTTLLQCLAMTRPVLAIGILTRTDAPEPGQIRAAMLDEYNADLEALARVDLNGEVALEARFMSGRRFGANSRALEFETRVTFLMEDRDIKRQEVYSRPRFKTFQEPLVVGYGAARHSHWGRKVEIAPEPDQNATNSLFEPAVEMTDPESILSSLDYASSKQRAGTRKLLDDIKTAMAKLLPDIDDPSKIILYGPASPGDRSGKSGVRVVTPYGEVPLSALSLGYQTMTAWTVDLAWRLFHHFPGSENPLEEPAIVLIDEIDLHLHPSWQRKLRDDLTGFFPNVQFIATAHSPLMAQSFLDANLVLVSKRVMSDRECYAEIDSDPAVVRTWRVDEIVTSDLFNISNSYPPEYDPLFKRRAELQHKPRLSAGEREELTVVQESIAALTTEHDPAFEQIMEALKRSAPRAV